MNRSTAFGGFLLLLCACSAPDPNPAAQQHTASGADATSDRAQSVAAADRAPVAAPATAVPQDSVPSMEADKQGKAALLRSSFEACIARAGGVTPEMQDCIAVEADYQDGRLALAYQALRASLPPADRQALVSEQDAWLAERKKVCAWNAAEEGQGQLLDAEGCALEMTAKHADQLEARLQRR